MMNESSSQPGVYHIREYGAMGNGDRLDSPAIQSAIDACAQSGGGTVVVPAGTYRCGPMQLRSGVRLHLAHRAVIHASDRIDDYLIGEADNKRRIGLFTADRSSDVTIDGDGVIDGRGGSFHIADRPHSKPDFVRDYTRQGDAYMSSPDTLVHGPVDFDQKPGVMLRFTDCENVTLRGITLRDSPGWATRFTLCRHVNLHDLRVDNDMLLPNNDGLHVVACQSVRIAHCDITAGDDAIAVSTLGIDTAAHEGVPTDHRRTEDVVVSDSVLRSRSAAVRIGYGPWEVRRVVLSNLVIHGSNRGIGVFTRNGGSVRDVRCHNVVIDTDLVAGHWWGNAEPIHLSATIGEDVNRVIPENLTSPGTIENVSFSHITARSAHGCVAWSEQPGLIRDVRFDQIDLRMRRSEWQAARGGNFDLRPSRDMSRSIFAHDIPAAFFYGVEGLTVRGFSVQWDNGLANWYTHVLHAHSCQDIAIDEVRGVSHDGRKPAILFEQCERSVVRSFGRGKEILRADGASTDCRMLEQ